MRKTPRWAVCRQFRFILLGDVENTFSQLLAILGGRLFDAARAKRRAGNR